MFHEDDGSVDVELLAECGAIAQRLRSLERSWSIELKDLQRKSLRSYGKPPLPSSLSITQKLNEIFDFTEADVALVTLKDSNKGDDPEFASRLRYLEDIVIKIHCQQELLRHKRTTTTTRKVHIKSNMNYSAATKHNNNDDLMTSPTGVRDDQQPHSCSSSSRDNNNKSLTNDDDDGAQNELSQENCSNKQIIYHQQQLQLCSQITSDDLKLLLRELKRKVDFTEKMNWLCKLTRLRRDTLLRVRKLDL